MSVSAEQSGEAIRFDEQGLVPCVMQDWRTGEVLTLAYMNEEALRLTRETGEVHFFSRSRGELWHKGETSGNLQRVRQLRYDCDGDAIVALVEPAGPACHTGQRSCFYRDLDGSADSAPEAPPSESAEPPPSAKPSVKTSAKPPAPSIKKPPAPSPQPSKDPLDQGRK